MKNFKVVKAKKAVKFVRRLLKIDKSLLESRAKEVPAAAVIPRRESVTGLY